MYERKGRGGGQKERMNIHGKCKGDGLCEEFFFSREGLCGWAEKGNQDGSVGRKGKQERGEKHKESGRMRCSKDDEVRQPLRETERNGLEKCKFSLEGEV